MRVLVGRVLPAMERQRGREVFSYALGAQPPGWWTVPHGPAITERRLQGLTFLAQPGCVGLGTLDVTEYYRSIHPETLARVLTDAGCAAGAIHAIEVAITGLLELGGPGGLPIGFEGSGPLGNGVLYPLDASLRSRVSFIRYTDDVWLFPKTESHWETLVSDAMSMLHRLGLKPHPGKTRLLIHPKDDPESVIRNRTLDSLTGAGDRLVPADVAIELLAEQFSTTIPDWTIVRFALSNLSRARDARAVRLLQDHPHIFTEEPVAVAKYLSAIVRDPKARKAVDHDWLVERALDKGSARTLARRLHACVVAADLRLGKDTGRQLFELATSIDDGGRAPLQVWAATAWGASEAWRQSRAVDAAEHFGNLQLRRAFCLPFKTRGASHKRSKMWKTHLILREPDLRPTLEYALL